MAESTIEQHPVAAGEHQPDIFAPDVVMLVLTWVTFFSLLAILKKFAWKPILDNLQKREDYIRQSLEDADQAKAQLLNVEGQKKAILEEAKGQAAQIISDARLTATEVGRSIESNAKKHAESILQSANAQIQGERQKVTQELKREAIDTAIFLAEKVLKENLDMDKNRKLMQEAVSKDMGA